MLRMSAVGEGALSEVAAATTLAPVLLQNVAQERVHVGVQPGGLGKNERGGLLAVGQ